MLCPAVRSRAGVKGAAADIGSAEADWDTEGLADGGQPSVGDTNITEPTPTNTGVVLMPKHGGTYIVYMPATWRCPCGMMRPPNH